MMKLHVIMLDRSPAMEAVLHLGESAPFGRRLVTIELTEEQAEMLQPRPSRVQLDGCKTEAIGEMWIEL